MPRPRKPKPSDPVTPVSATTTDPVVATVLEPVATDPLIWYFDGYEYHHVTDAEAATCVVPLVRVGDDVSKRKHERVVAADLHHLPHGLDPAENLPEGCTYSGQIGRTAPVTHTNTVLGETRTVAVTVFPETTGEQVREALTDGDDAYLAGRDPRTVPGTPEYEDAIAEQYQYEDPPIRCGTFTLTAEETAALTHRDERLTPLGDALRSLREQSDKSMGDIARALNCSVVYVSNAERGRILPPTWWTMDFLRTVGALDTYVGQVDVPGLCEAAEKAGVAVTDPCPEVIATPDEGMEWAAVPMREPRLPGSESESVDSTADPIWSEPDPYVTLRHPHLNTFIPSVHVFEMDGVPKWATVTIFPDTSEESVLAAVRAFVVPARTSSMDPGPYLTRAMAVAIRAGIPNVGAFAHALLPVMPEVGPMLDAMPPDGPDPLSTVLASPDMAVMVWAAVSRGLVPLATWDGRSLVKIGSGEVIGRIFLTGDKWGASCGSVPMPCDASEAEARAWVEAHSHAKVVTVPETREIRKVLP
jgi:DNA-binding transcriptional regulator YiaG